jgi:hypothetical protein
MDAPPNYGEARVERIACSWFRGTAFLAHTWTRDGRDWRRQVSLLPTDIARLEKLVQATRLGARRGAGPICRLVLVDATGQARKGHPEAIEPWLDWARALRSRAGEDWRLVRVREGETLSDGPPDTALGRWSRRMTLRWLPRSR